MIQSKRIRHAPVVLLTLPSSLLSTIMFTLTTMTIFLLPKCPTKEPLPPPMVNHEMDVLSWTQSAMIPPLITAMIPPLITTMLPPLITTIITTTTPPTNPTTFSRVVLLSSAFLQKPEPIITDPSYFVESFRECVIVRGGQVSAKVLRSGERFVTCKAAIHQ
ncbi:hypothetical protein BCR42DRAFT_420589 [Absidia repens]|uniref:Uncharacterized protein n=1 Tax=Absidia repens TaxID=90262 RepID=A0A1X2IA65_9FUNG|nr:hypothetical protein BCR42DRAFT_420589 [Absidia repens]